MSTQVDSPSKKQRLLVVGLGAVLLLGLGGYGLRRAGQQAIVRIAAESHTFGNEAELARWATIQRTGEVALEAVSTGSRLTAKGAASLRLEGHPRRAGYAPSVSLRFRPGSGPFQLELGTRAQGVTGATWTLTRIHVDGENVRCVAETATEENGERRVSTRDTPCAFEPGVGHELSTRLYVQHRVAFSSLDGSILPPESIVWFPQTAITPIVNVTWGEGGGQIDLEAFSMATPNEEYVSHGFDDHFHDSPMSSGRWYYVEADPSVAEVQTVLGGKLGVELSGVPRNMPKGVAAGILTSRQFELGAVDVGGDIAIDDLHESGVVVRLSADSYWQTHRMDVGVFHAGDRTIGYCSGNWDGKENFESLPQVYTAPSDRNLGTVRFKIAYEPRSGIARATIDGRAACEHTIDLPPYTGATMQIGTNLHGPDSHAKTRFTRGWMQPR